MPYGLYPEIFGDRFSINKRVIFTVFLMSFCVRLHMASWLLNPVWFVAVWFMVDVVRSSFYCKDVLNNLELSFRLKFYRIVSSIRE